MTLFSLERVHRKPPEQLPQSDEDRLMAQLKTLLPDTAFAFRGPDGVPDIVICWRGATLGLELKGRTESFTEAQAVSFPKLRDAGMRIEVVRDEAQALNRLRDMGVPLKEQARHQVRDSFREETRRRP